MEPHQRADHISNREPAIYKLTASITVARSRFRTQQRRARGEHLESFQEFDDLRTLFRRKCKEGIARGFRFAVMMVNSLSNR